MRITFRDTMTRRAMFVQICVTRRYVQFGVFRAEPRVGVRLFDCSLSCLFFRESVFNISSFFSSDSSKLSFFLYWRQFYLKKLKCEFQ